MLEDFFKLPGNPPDILTQDDFFKATSAGGNVGRFIYRPDDLKGSPEARTVRDCQFEEVSFSKTAISDIEFRKCTFTDCLFIASVFKDCRFTECTFVGCNPYRIRFIDTFIDPRSFNGGIDKKRFQNIGLHLYQELLNNSRRQSQPEFTQEALFEFRRWKRLEDVYKLFQKGTKGSRLRLAARIVLNWAAQTFLGYGVRLRYYFFWVAIVAVGLTKINLDHASTFGLMVDKQHLQSFEDAFYFTIVTLTTVGYGDITPTTEIGRMIMAGEAFCGFVLFATLASMIYRKILP